MNTRCRIALALLSLSAATLAAADIKPGFIIPVRVHLMQSGDLASVHTTLTEKDVQRVLRKVNGVWAQAGISFELESIRKDTALARHPEEESPKDRWLLTVIPPATRATNAFNIYYVKRMQPNGYWAGGVVFVKDTASLKEVPGGIDEPLPRVTSHELGHALGLPHRQDVTNLMASGTTGTNLNGEEIQHARERASRIGWVKKASKK